MAYTDYMGRLKRERERGLKITQKHQYKKSRTTVTRAIKFLLEQSVTAMITHSQIEKNLEKKRKAILEETKWQDCTRKDRDLARKAEPQKWGWIFSNRYPKQCCRDKPC